jgi:thiol-disulfide isomerase/thioredoxin
MRNALIAMAILSLVGASSLAIAPSLTIAAPKPKPSQRATPAPSPVPSPVQKPVQSSALAKELQGKPVLVDVYASWCGGCQAIKPTLSTLQKQYAGKVNFVVFDVTNKATTMASQAKAQRLGLGAFLAENKSKTATVAIINPANGQVLKLYQANPSLQDYTAVIDAAIAAR